MPFCAELFKDRPRREACHWFDVVRDIHSVKLGCCLKNIKGLGKNNHHYHVMTNTNCSNASRSAKKWALPAYWEWDAVLVLAWELYTMDFDGNVVAGTRRSVLKSAWRCVGSTREFGDRLELLTSMPWDYLTLVAAIVVSLQHVAPRGHQGYAVIHLAG